MDAWPGIGDGSITVTFRSWQRPQAKVGGRYRIGGMLIEADAVDQVRIDSITSDDAVRAGAADLASLLARLGSIEPDRLVWRVLFHHVGIDDRIERRQVADLEPDEIQAIVARLARLDRGAPWTRRTLQLIATYPGVVSTTLARHTGQERPVFKLNVRKLKEMGLTESLDIGYRLSPRGEAVLRHL